MTPRPSIARLADDAPVTHSPVEDIFVQKYLAAKDAERAMALLCIDCGINLADPPSKRCPGCEAYMEHYS